MFVFRLKEANQQCVTLATHRPLRGAVAIASGGVLEPKRRASISSARQALPSSIDTNYQR